MSLITVDPALCNKDGICALECPAKVIVLPEKDALPQSTGEANTYCISCGHCVAVCPTGALSLGPVNAAGCDAAQKPPDPETMAGLLRSRRSIRTYRKKPVPKQILETLINQTRWAPSGHNTQPLSWLILHDTQKMEGLISHVVDWMRYMIRTDPDFSDRMNMPRIVSGWEKGVDAVLRGAPHLILAHGAQSDPSAQNAAMIALSYLELAAPSYGLGTCLAGFFTAAAVFWPPLTKELLLPENHVALGAAMVGYPRFTYLRIPPRNPAKIAYY